jgi:type III restriction enzyme
LRLKEYQREALERLDRYTGKLDAARAKFDDLAERLADADETIRSAALASAMPAPIAWKALQDDGDCASSNEWVSLKDGWGQEIPHICFEMPTGSGKTLVAGHAVGRINTSLHHSRTGLVLWVVPSDAIYKQTLRQLRDRESAVRIALDTASGGAVKILEKLDSFTKADLQSYLCVMILMLQSAGKKAKEGLKVFRDSGTYASFFPQVDDLTGLAELRSRVPNLDRYDVADGVAASSVASGVKFSLGNVLRLARPIIILDEGHRAYSVTARETLGSLNPRLILELTATPDRKHSNVLVNVNGQALRDDQMVKLPIELAADARSTWKDTLAAAVQRLREVQKEADNLLASSGRYIRPILLVRVERTGREQRVEGVIHTEDAYEELTQKLGVPLEWIRRQTATDKELKDDDLAAENCQVRVIITKDALREGWDCPFAYVLALLPKGKAKTALTQMIGRVMRMPGVTYTGNKLLDRAHVFCADVDVKTAVARIKAGLEKEGMGDLATSAVAGVPTDKQTKLIERRDPFKGTRIMVPRVTHRDKAGGWRELDYDSDVLAGINWDDIEYSGASDLPLDGDGAERRMALIDLSEGDDFDLKRVGRVDRAQLNHPIDEPDLARRLGNVVPNAWVAMDLVRKAVGTLLDRAKGDESVVAKIRLTLLDDMRVRLQSAVQERAKAIFQQKLKEGEIQFKLRGVPYERLNWGLASSYEVDWKRGDKWLRNDDDDEVERTLFERVKDSDLNGYERAVALYADGVDAVSWWWRLVQRRDWGLQGWRRHKVYPDFLLRLDGEGNRVLVLETKGADRDNSDTQFKRELFEVLQAAYENGKDVGEMELIEDNPDAMRFRILMQADNWKSELNKALQ